MAKRYDAVKDFAGIKDTKLLTRNQAAVIALVFFPSQKHKGKTFKRKYIIGGSVIVNIKSNMRDGLLSAVYNAIYKYVAITKKSNPSFVVIDYKIFYDTFGGRLTVKSYNLRGKGYIMTRLDGSIIRNEPRKILSVKQKAQVIADTEGMV